MLSARSTMRTDWTATTLTLSVDGERFRVRLARIDAPELDQHFGGAARESLSTQVLDHRVRIETAGRERYGRVLGTVWLKGKSINKRLVADGWAWHYTRYSDSTEFAEAEKAARKGKLGLWAEATPVPPWEWRKRKTRPRAKASTAMPHVFLDRRF